jgi:pseudaminic acid cytidylyltransferase
MPGLSPWQKALTQMKLISYPADRALTSPIGGENHPSRSLCLIPARGGSKRIVRKNIRSFAGKPMISWPLFAALESKIFEQVVVSTDDAEIAELALSLGASVPFMRDNALSDDFASTAAVTIDALIRLAESGLTYDFVCCLYPTAVFTSAHDLSASFLALIKAESLTCLAVTPYPASPFKAMMKNKNHRIYPVKSEFQLTRSQDLPDAWHDAGQFCWSSVEPLIRDGRVCMADAIGYEMEKYSVVDIDEEVDFLFAQKVFLLGERGMQSTAL